jgi:arginyl-tRNA synthetase
MREEPNNIFATVLDRVHAAVDALAAEGALPGGLDTARILVEPPREAAHGDMATNAAMVLAKPAGKKPRELADAIAAKLRAEPLIEDVAVAGPGFINLTLTRSAWIDELRAALAVYPDYGKSDMGRRKRVNVEYVSANPTGPLHVGHTRGAVFGDALANLLAFTGFKVTREYYVNDAGAQVDVLARSAFLRYREALGEDIGAIPEGLYPGDYLKPVGVALAAEFGPSLRDKPEAEWLPLVRARAIAAMLAMIREDLAAINVRHNVFFSERLLIEKFTKAATETLAIVASYRSVTRTQIKKIRRLLSAPRMPSVLLENDWVRELKRGAGLIIYETTEVFLLHFGVRSISDFLGRKKLTLGARVSYVRREIEARLAKIGATSTSSAVRATIKTLRYEHLIYQGRLPPPKGQPIEDWEDREQTLFRATQFGDDVDRPLMKSDGSYTYFASDIAYHKSKLDRGFRTMIDVWGADHGGYVKRVQAAVKAISGGAADLDVKIVQLVKLLRAGEPVKMSKRAGEFVTLREVVDEVGRDAVRFMMLYRKNDAPLEFDLAKVIEQSRDNPVFYVQYGHARGQSVLRNARAVVPDLPEVSAERAALLARAPLDRLDDPAELALIKRIALYPRVVEAAAGAHEPHRIAFYLYDLASELHAQWTRGNDLPHLRFIIQNDPQLTTARLALIQGVVAVLASGLELLGVGAPDEMR